MSRTISLPDYTPNPPFKKLPGFIEPTKVQFESGEYLYGYRIEKIYNSLRLKLYSFPWNHIYEGMGFSVHLLDQGDGRSLANRDETLKRSHFFPLFGGTFIQVYVQNVELVLPSDVPTNRAMWIILTLWREHSDDYVRQIVLSSDLPLLSDTQVILDEFVLPEESPPATSPPLARFENGIMLETVDMPERARSGEQMNITFAWRADRIGEEDYIQFLHLGNEDTGEWFVYDQPPLGARLPTRLWYSGLADSETWHIPIPADLVPGSYVVFTGLYSVPDQERLPVTDADGAPWLDNRVPLGSLIIE